MSGYFVISYFRLSSAGRPPEPYVEVERKWYRWKWWANLAAKPRMFITKLAPGEFGFIRTDVVPASLALDSATMGEGPEGSAMPQAAPAVAALPSSHCVSRPSGLPSVSQGE